MAEDPGMRAHRLATAVVRQWLGEGHSLYNTVRDVLIEEFADEPSTWPSASPEDGPAST